MQIPERINHLPDGPRKFNLILDQAAEQGIIQEKDREFYRQIWNRGRKMVYWSRHIKDLTELLEQRERALEQVREKPADPGLLPGPEGGSQA